MKGKTTVVIFCLRLQIYLQQLSLFSSDDGKDDDLPLSTNVPFENETHNSMAGERATPIPIPDLDKAIFDSLNFSSPTPSGGKQCDPDVKKNQTRVWDPQSQSAGDFYRGHCSKCQKLRKPEICQLCYSLECFPCDCDERCTLGTCCAEFLPEAGDDGWKTTGCVDGGYYAITRCPDSWTDDLTRQACEEDIGHYTSDEPVTDLTTEVTYRNDACATCHHSDVHTAWHLEAVCNHFQHIYTAESQEEFFDKAKADTDVCRLRRRPPDEAEPKDCPDDDVPWFSDPVDFCNVTGLWETHDEDIEVGCLSLTELSYRVYHPANKVVFANVLCAVCNGFPFEITDCPSKNEDTLGPGFGSHETKRLSPLTLLFGFQQNHAGSEEVYAEQCSDKQSWLTPDNECRNLSCTAGKILENGTCSTAVTQIRGLVYSLDITFSLSPPLELRVDNREHISALKTQAQRLIFEKLEKRVKSFDVTLFIGLPPLFDVPSIPDVYTVKQVRVIGDVTAPRQVNRDEAEDSIVENIFFNGWNITVNGNTSILEVQNVKNTTLEPFGAHPFNIQYDQEGNIWRSEFPADLKVRLTPMLTCPHLEFTETEYEIQTVGENETGTQLMLIFGDTDAELQDLKQTWLDGESLYVCSDALKTLERPEKRRRWGDASWQYILTMVMMPLSMLCLVLTLAVYALLPALRTQPGFNTMGTCCALLLAQLTLLLASHRVVSGAWCKALGVLVHVSWLSVFCWTSVCSFHMFRAFSAKTYHRSSSGLCLRLARNVVLTILAPAVVVGAVIGASSLTSDGASIGYSGSTCYLESPLLVGLSVVLPVSLLLLFNLVLFVITVCRIYRVTKLNPRAESDTRDSQQHVHICARLSLLTGATWIFALVAEGLGVDWLQFFSIVANAGQGLLLFLSYVTTRRVLKMLAVKLGCKVKLSPSRMTSSSSTSHTKFSSDVISDKHGGSEKPKQCPES